MRGERCIPARRSPIGRGPFAVREIAVVGGILDHAVQRDVFDDFELLSLRVPRLASLLGVRGGRASFSQHGIELGHRRAEPFFHARDGLLHGIDA
jgi:hypothetical protein